MVLLCDACVCLCVLLLWCAGVLVVVVVAGVRSYSAVVVDGLGMGTHAHKIHHACINTKSYRMHFL